MYDLGTLAQLLRDGGTDVHEVDVVDVPLRQRDDRGAVTLAHRVGDGQVVLANAHARIDDWPTAADWILERLT